MDEQTERIEQLEKRVARLYHANQHAVKGGQMTARLGKALKQKVALNTSSIESFERTIADMQAQIDELVTAKE